MNRKSVWFCSNLSMAQIRPMGPPLARVLCIIFSGAGTGCPTKTLPFRFHTRFPLNANPSGGSPACPAAGGPPARICCGGCQYVKGAGSRMSQRKQFATGFSDFRDMPLSKHLTSVGSPQARQCSSLVRLGGELESALGAFSWDILSRRRKK